MKRILMLAVLAVMVMAVKAEAASLFDRDTYEMQPTATGTLKRLWARLAIAQKLESLENVEFAPTEIHGGLVTDGAALRLAERLIDCDYAALSTALEVVDKALGTLGLTAVVRHDTDELDFLGKMLSALSEKLTNPDTGKMSWDLYVEVQAGKLAKEISSRIESRHITVDNVGRITGFDLGGALGVFFYSNEIGGTIKN